MPTPFDCMATVANSDYANIKDNVVLRNRTLIISVMTKYHFKVAQSEWCMTICLRLITSKLEKFSNTSKYK